MDIKKTLLIFLIVFAVLSGLSAVSSTTPDSFLLNDSLVNVYYSEPQESTDYAYYYENGNYASEAYWAPWSADATINLDVNGMYKQTVKDKSNYTLDEFKEDLATMINNGEVKVTNFMIRGVHAENINDTDISYSLDDNSSVLTISFSYAPDDVYGDKIQSINKINSLANATNAYTLLSFGDLEGLSIEHEKQLANKSFNLHPKVESHQN